MRVDLDLDRGIAIITKEDGSRRSYDLDFGPELVELGHLIDRATGGHFHLYSPICPSDLVKYRMHMRWRRLQEFISEERAMAFLLGQRIP